MDCIHDQTGIQKIEKERFIITQNQGPLSSSSVYFNNIPVEEVVHALNFCQILSERQAEAERKSPAFGSSHRSPKSGGGGGEGGRRSGLSEMLKSD